MNIVPISLSILLSVLCISVKCQTLPTIQFQKCYGGLLQDRGTDIAATFDGGYIVCGYCRSSTGNLTSNKGGYDIWVVKLNKDGNIEWQKSYGSIRNDQAYSIKQTADSGYIVAGSSSSFWGLSRVDDDIWVFKLSRNGTMEWESRLSGTGEEEANAVVLTADGGYAVAGYSYSFDGDFANKRGSCVVFRLNNNGSLKWMKTFGGNGDDVAASIVETKEGDLLVAGKSSSTNNDITDNHGKLDYLLLKLDSAGNKIWAKSFGGTEDDRATTVKQTRDGGYILSGSSASFASTSFIDFHYWLIKLDTAGQVQWTTPTNASPTFYPYSIEQTTDNGYVVGGSSYSFFPGEHGNGDFWIAKFNENGKFQWQKFMGGNAQDYGRVALQTADEGYIITGMVGSTTMDVSGNHGDFDLWVVKLGPVNDNASLCPPASSLSMVSELTGSNYRWQVNDGNGYVDLSDNSFYTGTTSRTLYLNNIPSSWYNYRYRCFADSTCGKTFTLKYTSTWTGATDTTWETPSNWSCNAVPDEHTDVIINKGTPVLNSNTSCRSLSLTNGATLTVNPAKLLDVKN